MTGLSPGAEPRRRTSPPGRPGAGRRHTVLDLDYRPMFWAEPAEAHAQVQRGAARTSRSPSATARSARWRSARPTRTGRAEALLDARGRAGRGQAGPARCAGARPRDEGVEVPPVPVEVVNGLGAGDAFGGALCHGLLAGWPLERTCGSPTRPVRSSPPGWSARPRCRPTAEVDALLGPSRAMDRDRERLDRASASPRADAAGAESPRRRRHAGGRRARCSRDGRLLIVAADHPARGALGVRGDPMAMADRADAAGAAGRPRWPGPASTACWAPRTSSRTCCCWARWRARS